MSDLRSDMAALLEPLIPPLRRYARTLLRDRADADDLVQDCLEHAIDRWRQRRQEGDARSWTFTILHNLAMTRLRRSGRRGPHLAIDDAAPEALSQAPAQEEGLRHRDVVRALDRLPEDQRSVLLLVTVEDMSYADVARVLDIPLGTVMSRLSRARERMRRLVEEDGAARTDIGPARDPGSHLRRVK